MPKSRAVEARVNSDYIRATWALARARILVWTCPTGRLLDSRTSVTTRSVPVGDERATRLARAVDLTARGPLRATCLVRALALQSLLQAVGLFDGRIRIGVRASEGSFLAHAWVEYGGAPLGSDGARAGAFCPLALEALGRGAEFGT